MSEVKQHLTYKEQIEKLRSRGCIITDDEFCEKVLENIGSTNSIGNFGICFLRQLK